MTQRHAHPDSAPSESLYQRVRRRTYEVLETRLEKEKRGSDHSSRGTRLSLTVDIVIIAVIVANVAAIVLESFEGLHARFEAWFSTLEQVSVALFTVELALRLWTCDVDSKQPWPGAAIRFLISPIGIIDLLAILPFYLPFLIPVDLRMVRILRLVRLLKLTRYMYAIATLAKVVEERRKDLMVAVFLTSSLLAVAATLMYYLESTVQPEAFPNIVAAMWWAVATLTTVGYGDVFPITDLGRLLSGIIAVLGIGLVALPTAIISSGYVEALERKSKAAGNGEELERTKSKAAGNEEASCVCPHCGKPLDAGASTAEPPRP